GIAVAVHRRGPRSAEGADFAGAVGLVGRAVDIRSHRNPAKPRSDIASELRIACHRFGRAELDIWGLGIRNALRRSDYQHAGPNCGHGGPNYGPAQPVRSGGSRGVGGFSWWGGFGPGGGG